MANSKTSKRGLIVGAIAAVGVVVGAGVAVSQPWGDRGLAAAWAAPS